MSRRTVGLVSSIVSFLVLLFDAKGHYQLAALDNSILISLQQYWSEPINAFIRFITDLSGHVAVPIFGFCLIVFLTVKRDWKNVAFSFSSLLGSLLLFTLFKEWVGRARPESKLFDPGHYSFPSGHAAISTVMALTVYYVFKSRVKPSKQNLFLIACFLFPIIISFTRIFLNVHYPSDVIAGVAISTSWIILLSFIYHPK